MNKQESLANGHSSLPAESTTPPERPTREESSTRRTFLQTAGLGAALLGLGQRAFALDEQTTNDLKNVGANENTSKDWKPVSDRKIRVGVVGFGLCQFGAQFGFQDHPNVEIVAVSDLIPERCEGLAKACRCSKTYPSLEELVKDDKIEAVFVATDAPHHAQHCAEVMKHGKDVACAVPAVWGSLEDADMLFETVKTTGKKYMMFETSYYHDSLHAMRQIYQAGGFGKLIYSEGEYCHYQGTPIPSYKDWRVGYVPLWYPTHATAYYVGVTGKSFVSVSCTGVTTGIREFQLDGNKYGNRFSDEIALFETAEGGTSRMMMCCGMNEKSAEAGRVFGEKGWMDGMSYQGSLKELPYLQRPALPPSVEPGGHGGSHGYLMNEFVLSILENRKPAVDIVAALNMTVSGVVADQSARKDGERLKVPQYSL